MPSQDPSDALDHVPNDKLQELLQFLKSKDPEELDSTGFARTFQFANGCGIDRAILVKGLQAIGASSDVDVQTVLEPYLSDS